MINKKEAEVSECWERFKPVVLYLVFGVLTTIINVIAYYVCTELAGWSTLPSTLVAWFLAVLGAYITNRKAVFGSNASGFTEIAAEIVRFIASRIATGVLDLVLMIVCVDMLGLPGTLMKFVSNVIVVILNYVASKLLVFTSTN